MQHNFHQYYILVVPAVYTDYDDRSRTKSSLQDTKEQSAKVFLLSVLQLFEFKRVYNVLNSFKKRGYSIHDIFPLLLILPFLKHASIHALFKSRSKDLSCAQKDVYYRFKNLEVIPWRRLLINFVKRLHACFFYINLPPFIAFIYLRNLSD